jgi:hypothetical protein
MILPNMRVGVSPPTVGANLTVSTPVMTFVSNSSALDTLAAFPRVLIFPSLGALETFLAILAPVVKSKYTGYYHTSTPLL